jgi:hypothetical protein
VPTAIKCLRTRENDLLKIDKLSMWLSDWQGKGDNVSLSLIRQKAKRIFDNPNASLYWHLFTKKKCV